MSWVAFAVGISCLLTCGLLAGMETGIYTLNRVRLAAKAARNEAPAKRLLAEMQHPNRLLATVLVGMNLAHAALSAATTWSLESITDDPLQLTLLNTVIVLPLVFLFGDALPKELFRVFTNSWSYACSGILLVLRVGLTWTGFVPIVRLLGDGASYLLGFRRDQEAPRRQRILQSLRDGLEADLIKDVHLDMADRLFGLSERRVSQCTVPWARVVRLPEDAPDQLRRRIFSEQSFSRVPIYRTLGAQTTVVGVVSSLDALLQPQAGLVNIAQEPLVIDPSTLVLDAARTMRNARRRMAVVWDGKSAAPLGIITLKDVVEPIFGSTPEW